MPHPQMLLHRRLPPNRGRGRPGIRPAIGAQTIARSLRGHQSLHRRLDDRRARPPTHLRVRVDPREHAVLETERDMARTHPASVTLVPHVARMGPIATPNPQRQRVSGGARHATRFPPPPPLRGGRDGHGRGLRKARGGGLTGKACRPSDQRSRTHSKREHEGVREQATTPGLRPGSRLPKLR